MFKKKQTLSIKPDVSNKNNTKDVNNLNEKNNLNESEVLLTSKSVSLLSKIDDLSDKSLSVSCKF